MLCRVCLCSPVEAHPTVGFAVFPSRPLHAALRSCSCCNPSRFGGRLLLGTTLCTFPEEPRALEEDFSSISQFSPNPQLSSAALGWLISTAGGILLSSSQLPGSPSPSCKCNPSVADSCINFLLPAEFLRGTVHFTNPVCISTMTFTIKLFLQGGGGCVYLQAWLNSIFI